MTGAERCYKYVEDVKSGKILTNRYIKLAVKRFENDLKRSKKKDPDFPYYFDEEKANKFIAFTECLKQYQGKFKDKPLILEDWQCFFFCQLYGWLNKETNFRRFQKALLFVARKNGKTQMLGASVLYDLLIQPGGQAFALSTKKEQSRLLYQAVLEMVKSNPGLSNRLKVYTSTYRIVNQSLASYFEPLSADARKLDGLNPSIAVVDELAAQKNVDLLNIMQSGMGAREEPLLISITSGGHDLHGAGKQEFDRSARILEGTAEDNTYLALLYCLDENDNWKDESKYIKANPNLNVSVNAEFLHNQRITAEQQPSMEGEFRCKNLNQWVTSLSAWIPNRVWEKAKSNAEKYRLDKYDLCVGALDLSEKYDFTAFTLCFYSLKDNKYFFRHRFYIPQNQVEAKMKTDSEMIMKWIEDGYITATYGNIVDYNYMLEDIKKAMREYDIKEILYDPYNSNSLITDLSELIDTIEITQSIKYISPFAKEYEAALIDGQVVDNNPVQSWMITNASIYRDANGNIKPIKDETTGGVKRIDGVITALMSLGRVKALIDEGLIDTRTPEQVFSETSDFLKNLQF